MGFDIKEAGKKLLGITGHEAPEDPAPQGEKDDEEIKEIDEIDEGFKTLEELEAEREKALEKELEEDLAEGVEEVQAEENQDSTSEKDATNDVTEDSVVDTVKEEAEETEEKEETEEAEETEPAPVLQEPQELHEPQPYKMRKREFYDGIGDLAYEFDRTGVLKVDLKSYLLSVVERREDIQDDIIRRYLGDFLGRHEEAIPTLDSLITSAADYYVKVDVRFTNQKNGKSYNTWEDAVDSISEMIEYGVKPENVFEKHYFWVDRPDVELTDEELEDYVSDFRGDVAVLKKKLFIEEENSKE